MSALGSSELRFDERFVTFDCDSDACLGVLAVPKPPVAVADLGVLVIVGGPQTRVGSHRQFVLLARALAAAGYPAFRFDYRGMGDSAGDSRTFEHIRIDIVAALDAFQKETGIARFVLWGLCDGASAAWMDGGEDRRVAGIVALNPWARSPQGEAATRLRHYYLQRLLEPAFWRKVFSGGFRVGQRARELAGAVHSATQAPAGGLSTAYLQRIETGWQRFAAPLLIVLSGNDYTAREFEGWVGAARARAALMSRRGTTIHRLPDADHTFSARAWRDEVTERTIEWLAEISRRS